MLTIFLRIILHRNWFVSRIKDCSSNSGRIISLLLLLLLVITILLKYFLDQPKCCLQCSEQFLLLNGRAFKVLRDDLVNLGGDLVKNCSEAKVSDLVNYLVNYQCRERCSCKPCQGINININLRNHRYKKTQKAMLL